MAEIRPLTDYFNPMQTGMQAMQLLNQQENIAINQAQLEQSKRAQDESALQQLYKDAPPMAQYPLFRKLMENRGLGAAVPNVDEFYATPSTFDALASHHPDSPEYKAAYDKWLKASPASRKLVEEESQRLLAQRGAKELNTAAGLGSSPAMAQLTVSSPAVQTQAANVVAKTGLEQEKEQALKAKRMETEQIVANVHVQERSLIPTVIATKGFLDRIGPVLDAMGKMDQEYEKNVVNMGRQKAEELRKLARFKNADVDEFLKNKDQAKEKLRAGLKQMDQMQMQLETRLELLASGADAPKEGESLQTVQAQVEALRFQSNINRAQLKFAEDSTLENYGALHSAYEDASFHLSTLDERKRMATERLDVQRGTLDLKEREFSVAQAEKGRIAKGQQQLTDLAAKIGQEAALKQAGRIAAENEVSVSDITKALKDPDRIPIAITMSQEKAEAQKVGAGFGEEFVNTQKLAAAANDNLARLSRMEQLLEGVETGRLTTVGTQFNSLAKSFGIDLDPKLGAKQAAQALARQMALELRNPSGGAGMPGAMSDADREFLVSMTPGLETTPEGNKLIIETGRKVAKRVQKVAEIARTYRKKHGQLDEGFYDELQAYSDAHPMFEGQAVPSAASPKAPSGVAPFNDPDKERRYQEWKKSHK
jgi:hypothetical protein